MRIDAIQIRKAKNEIRVSFSESEAGEKAPNLTQKKIMVINELETVVWWLKRKKVESGGQAGFESGWFDLLLEWPGSKANHEGDGS